MKRLSRIIIGLLVVASALSGCVSMRAGEWVTLFDGKDLDHWYILGDADWKLEKGLVMADRKIGKDNGYLVTRKKYSNFQLRVEF
ncbi:MAG: 3-keto-disaccharide hydrolase, partial [Burkholderiales bacterium]